MGRRVNDRYQYYYPKPEAEKRALRDLIRGIDPDILAVQEMGKWPYLWELRRDLKSEGLNYPHIALFEGEDPVRHLALLSKLAFETTLVAPSELNFFYGDEQHTPKRGLQAVVFTTKDGKQWTLFNLHLKSRLSRNKSDPQSRYRRTAEARSIALYIEQNYANRPNALYLMVGDWNDGLESPALNFFLQPRPNNRLIAKSIPCQDKGGKTWTYHYRKKNSHWEFDHLLASPRLFQKLVDGRGYIAQEVSGSDHRLIYADFEFGVE